METLEDSQGVTPRKFIELIKFLMQKTHTEKRAYLAGGLNKACDGLEKAMKARTSQDAPDVLKN